MGGGPTIGEEMKGDGAMMGGGVMTGGGAMIGGGP